MSDVRITQKQLILEHLRKFRSITQRDALEFGCYRLASRIAELKDLGHDIRREMVTDRNQAGETIRYARYWLVMGEEETNV